MSALAGCQPKAAVRQSTPERTLSLFSIASVLRAWVTDITSEPEIRTESQMAQANASHPHATCRAYRVRRDQIEASTRFQEQCRLSEM